MCARALLQQHTNPKTAAHFPKFQNSKILVRFCARRHWTWKIESGRSNFQLEPTLA